MSRAKIFLIITCCLLVVMQASGQEVRALGGKRFIIVYTKRNCFSCFNVLNRYLGKNHLRLGQAESSLIYFFPLQDFMSSKIFVAKLDEVKNTPVVMVSDSTEKARLLSVINPTDEMISPFVIIDSVGNYRVLPYHSLFKENGQVNKVAFR